MSKLLEGHTIRRFDGELNNLHLMVLEMGGLVLDQCRRAVASFRDGLPGEARLVLGREADVDALELKVDEHISWVVGRRSPLARDLRVVLAFSKAVTDLERVGDEAVRIAHTTLSVYQTDSPHPNRKLLRDFEVMSRIAIAMLEEAVGLFDTFDPKGAERLLAQHAELDAEFQSSLRRLSTFVLEDARNVGHVVNAVLLVRALERIGEHSRNLAEYVIYLVRGDDVRHAEGRSERSGEA